MNNSIEESPGLSSRRRVLAWPISRLGWWAVTLAAAFLALFIFNVTVLAPASDAAAWRQAVLPLYGITMLMCGLAGGILGLVAILRRRERSLLVWLTLLPGVFVLVFILGELLGTH